MPLFQLWERFSSRSTMGSSKITRWIRSSYVGSRKEHFCLLASSWSTNAGSVFGDNPMRSWLNFQYSLLWLQFLHHKIRDRFCGYLAQNVPLVTSTWQSGPCFARRKHRSGSTLRWSSCSLYPSWCRDFCSLRNALWRGNSKSQCLSVVGLVFSPDTKKQDIWHKFWMSKNHEIIQ